MEFFIAILLVLAGGVCEGLFSLGVTRTPKWQWENIWGLGSFVALVLVPWPVAWLTVPNLMEVLQSVSPSVLLTTFLFGLGWGLGGIFWGKAIAAVGVALGVSLLMGLTTVFGSPVPLAIQDPAALGTPGGLTLLAALAVMVVGVVVCALAGRQKDIELREAQDPNSQASKATPFAIGLLFCVISGILSAMVNFGLVFGQPIAEAASNAGATAASKNNARQSSLQATIWSMSSTQVR
ncbi:MAG: hypothetical protein GXP26_00460 [Planctomycetes bacterium]|nr:hypothetical protein [Planctomycetota bacterium]